jgi:hypothetical protein
MIPDRSLLFPHTLKDTHTPAYPCCFTTPSPTTLCCIPSRKQVVNERQDQPAVSSTSSSSIIGVSIWRHGCEFRAGKQRRHLGELKGDFLERQTHDLTILFLFAYFDVFVCILLHTVFLNSVDLFSVGLVVGPRSCNPSLLKIAHFVLLQKA